MSSNDKMSPGIIKTGIYVDNNNLFYITGNGVVFYSRWALLADQDGDDAPYRVDLVSGVPSTAKLLTTDLDCPNSRAVLEWIDACDMFLGSLSAEISEIRHEANDEDDGDETTMAATPGAPSTAVARALAVLSQPEVVAAFAVLSQSGVRDGSILKPPC